MQKKKNIKFKLIDLIIILLCIAGSLVSAKSFWQEYTRTLTKLNEAPVGTVTFKKRTAQRKFIDRIVWDMLKQASGVYNGDTLRTIELSEAVISFRDEVTNVTMNENTLIQIFYNDTDGARINFSGGNLEVNSGNTSVTIISGSSEIIVAGQANLDKRDEGFFLSVLEGEAVFDGEIIETDNILIINEQGERNEKPAIAMTSFNTSMRIAGKPGAITPVIFSWNAYNFDSDTFVIVETSLDPAFKHIVQTASVTGNTTASIPMENGEYFWRVYPAATGSKEPANPMYPQGTLEIIPASSIEIITLQETYTEVIPETATENIKEKFEEIAVISEAQTAKIITPQPAETSVTNTQTETPSAVRQFSEFENLFFNINNWQNNTGPGSSVNFSMGKELIDGLEKDVFTFDANVGGGNLAYAEVMNYDPDIAELLKTANGIRFKVLGDGKQWIVAFPATNVKDYGWHMGRFTATNNRIVDVDVPFSTLRQLTPFAERVRFNKELIIGMHFGRTWYIEGGRSPATIKIFDVELY